MTSPDELTPEQRTVVRHKEGPAAALAVPGAGKTTVLIHRIRFLVEERGVPPDDNLLCSFNRATVGDVKTRLRRLSIGSIDVRTLHSLGLSVLRDANERERRSRSSQDDVSPPQRAHSLAREAIRAHADGRDVSPHEVPIDPNDLVDRVAAWKHRLAYPDLEGTGLPEEAHSQREAAQKARKRHEAALSDLTNTVDERLQPFRDVLGATTLSAGHDRPESFYPEAARFTFEWDDEVSRVRVYWKDQSVGSIDPFAGGQHDAGTLIELPWSELVGTFAGMARGRKQLRIAIDWDATRERRIEAEGASLSPPPRLGEMAALLTSEAFDAGYQFLRERLADQPAPETPEGSGRESPTPTGSPHPHA